MAREPEEGTRDAAGAGRAVVTRQEPQRHLAPIFETMRVLGGRVPFLDRHLERLVGSCPRVNLIPPPRDLADHAVAHALRPPADRVLRIEWNGATLTWDDRNAEPMRRMRLVVSGEPHPGYPVKSTVREAFDRATADVAARDADEPLLLTPDGAVAETARFAVAWLHDGIIRMPSLELEILPSIGRIRVLELAEAQGLRVEVGAWPRSALADRPVFLMNAARGVVPVTSLDGHPVPRHPRVAEFAEAFWPRA